MESVEFKEYELSRLMLGTVQFGLNYGIANNTGQPAYETACDIVAYAFEHGVNCFDTAAAYGTSEEVLGKIFQELGITDQVTVVSKIAPVSRSNVPPEKLESFIENSLQQSLKNLKLDVLPICLFHHEEDLPCIETLQAMKEKGLVRYIGLSADTAEGAELVINHPAVEATQIPHNLFDRRFTSKKLLETANRQQMAVFTRSTYLQGLLVMPIESIPEQHQAIIPIRRQLDQLALESGMTISELCMRYSLSNPAITCILTGVDSLPQLKENIAVFSKGALPAELVQQVNDIVPDLPEQAVRPFLWQP